MFTKYVVTYSHHHSFASPFFYSLLAPLYFVFSSNISPSFMLGIYRMHSMFPSLFRFVPILFFIGRFKIIIEKEAKKRGRRETHIILQMTDDEKFLWKNFTPEMTRHFLRENVKDIIAVGYDINKTFIFSNLEYVGYTSPLPSRILSVITSRIFSHLYPTFLLSLFNPFTYFLFFLQADVSYYS